MRRSSVVVLLVLCAVSVQAVDYNKSPQFGSFRIDEAGTETIELVAGGRESAGEVGGIGWVTDGPSVRLFVEAEGDLVISVSSRGDTTLLVNAPDVSWHSNDDHNGVNPQVSFMDAQTGQYDIWVGTWLESEARATLTIRFEGEPAVARPDTPSEVRERPSTAGTWSSSDYARYDYRSFASSELANARIDFDNIDYGLLHAAVFYETNRNRVAQGLPVFEHNQALEQAAYEHSVDMRDRNFFSHTSPVSGKRTLADRVSLVGFRYSNIGENIAITFGIEYQAGRGVFNPQQNGGYFSYEHRGDPIENHTYLGVAQAVLTQWMNSPGHRANILNRNFTHLGAGGAHYQDAAFYNMDKFYFTQNFGRPR